MERTTRKTVETVFEYFLKAINGRKAKDYKDVDGYRLDYNPIYGGYVVEQIVNDGGGVSRPFGDRRRAPAEMVSTLNFVMEVLREKAKVA